jgi:hypothetical protein
VTSRRPDVGLLAGWLFADLLLGFAIIVVAASTGGLPGKSSSVRAPIPTTTSTTSGTSVAPTTVGVEQTPHVIEIEGSFNAAMSADATVSRTELGRMVEVLRQRLVEGGLVGRRAALVLSFGFHPSVGAGQRLAQRFNSRLQESMPDVFGSAALRFFDYRSQPAGRVRAEIYFFTK